jgi:hypothetical protein
MLRPAPADAKSGAVAETRGHDASKAVLIRTERATQRFFIPAFRASMTRRSAAATC